MGGYLPPPKKHEGATNDLRFIAPNKKLGKRVTFFYRSLVLGNQIINWQRKNEILPRNKKVENIVDDSPLLVRPRPNN